MFRWISALLVLASACVPAPTERCSLQFEITATAPSALLRAGVATVGEDLAWLWCSDTACELRRVTSNGATLWTASVLTAAYPLVGEAREVGLLAFEGRLYVSTATQTEGLARVGQLEVIDGNDGTNLSVAEPWPMSRAPSGPVVGLQSGRVFAVRNFQAVSEGSNVYGEVLAFHAGLESRDEASLPSMRRLSLGTGTSGEAPFLVSFDARTVIRPRFPEPVVASVTASVTAAALAAAETVLTSDLALSSLSASSSGAAVVGIDAEGGLIANVKLPRVEQVRAVAVADGPQSVVVALLHDDRTDVWIVRDDVAAIATTLRQTEYPAVVGTQRGFAIAVAADGVPQLSVFECGKEE